MYRLGQALQGRLGKYVITKEIQDTVWFAKNHKEELVVIKAVKGHPRVRNERDVLQRFQTRTHLRPMLDEIDHEPNNPAIVLEYLDDHLHKSSLTRTLNRKELRLVLRRVLETLEVLHGEGYVHTDIKSDNVFVNYGSDVENRFSNVLLGDLGGAYSVSSRYAMSGTRVGSPLWMSPEIIMETPWNTASDIWSFGVMAISLMYGGHFHVFQPAANKEDPEEHYLEILKQQFRFFGPFPPKYDEIASQDTAAVVIHLMDAIPQSQTIPFEMVSEREISREDNVFIRKIMKLDWRDRPSARDLLADVWFQS